MPFGTATHNVTTSPTKVIDTNEGAQSVEIHNPDTEPVVYYGGSDVDTDTGLPIYPGQTKSFDLRGVTDDVYIIGTEASVVRKSTLT